MSIALISPETFVAGAWLCEPQTPLKMVLPLPRSPNSPGSGQTVHGATLSEGGVDFVFIRRIVSLAGRCISSIVFIHRALTSFLRVHHFKGRCLFLRRAWESKRDFFLFCPSLQG